MDDNKVFDDKPLNNMAAGEAQPASQYKSTQIPVANNESPKDIWDEKSVSRAYSGLNLNSPSDLKDTTRADLKDNSKIESSKQNNQDFSDYYRQTQNQQNSSFNNSEQLTASPPAPGPRDAHVNTSNTQEIELAPKTQQTYEQAESSAKVANYNMQVKKKSKLKGLIFALIIFLVLIAGLVGAFFYLKFINTPQYKLKQAADNFSKQKSDISLNYQVKKGSVYEDIVTINEKSDANNNIENEINFKLGSSNINLNIVSEAGKNYFKLNGVEGASKELEKNSASLSKTIKSTGVVLDDQWVELDQFKNLIMPSSLISQLYPLTSAINKNSITEVSKSDEDITYSLNLDAEKVRAIITSNYNAKASDYLKQYNIKIDDYLKPDKIAKLSYKVVVSKKQKTITKLVISTNKEDKIINFNFTPHNNQKVISPTQSKKFSEVSRELETATSQSGINIGPLLQ